jgi:hypothetical protein
MALPTCWYSVFALDGLSGSACLALLMRNARTR